MLALGNFREGWDAYDYRFAIGGNKWLRPEAHAEPWTGEPLAGKSILVLGEQGTEVPIQAHYAGTERSRRIGVVPRAAAAASAVRNVARVRAALLTEIPSDGRFDFQCPLMSLPGRFVRQGMPIPTRTPYLGAEPERVARWKNRIGDHGFKVAVAWWGNQYGGGEDLRSFRIDALRALAAVPGVRLISLQLKEGTEQLANLPGGMRVEVLDFDFDAGEHGFLDSAAVLGAVDLVISCDTSIAHLAGALVARCG